MLYNLRLAQVKRPRRDAATWRKLSSIWVIECSNGFGNFFSVGTIN